MVRGGIVSHSENDLRLFDEKLIRSFHCKLLPAGELRRYKGFRLGGEVVPEPFPPFERDRVLPRLKVGWPKWRGTHAGTNKNADMKEPCRRHRPIHL